MRVALSRRALLAGLAAAPAARAAPRRPLADADVDRILRKAAALPQLDSLLVARDGATAIGRAFNGAGLYAPTNVKSASKTLLSAMVGVAIERGVLEGVDQKVAPLLGDRIPKGADPAVAEITVGHLLTMRAGLQGTSGGAYVGWVSSPDWLADALSRPMIARPGGRYIYSTGTTHILGVALARAAGRDLHGLAQEWLGDPLGETLPPWTRCPTGEYLGGNDMRVSPVGLLRFGEMYRLGGVWAGRQVAPAWWVAQSWRARTRSAGSKHAYGYAWFLSTAYGHDVSFARGYGGQMLYVAPSLGLVAVATSDHTRPAPLRGHTGRLNSLFANDIMGAAVGAWAALPP